MPRDAAHMPGSRRARGLLPGAGNRRRPWARAGLEGTPAPCSTRRRSGASSRRSRKTRREGVSTVPAPPAPAGLSRRHLHRGPLGRGSENPRPGCGPASRTASAPLIVQGSEEAGGFTPRALHCG